MAASITTPEHVAEGNKDHVQLEGTERRIAELEHERDQYAYAIRQLILQVKTTAYAWVTTMPDSISTAGVAHALDDLCSPVVTREGLRGGGRLRDDLWSAIVGAYYLRFQNDGHPEDSEAAADEAMAIVQPELNRLTVRAETAANERDQARATSRRLNRRAQEAESKLAAYERAVAEWVIGDQGTYIPIESVAVIARIAGLDVDHDRFEVHYQRMEKLRADRDRLASEVERQVGAKAGVAGEWGDALADKAAAEAAIARVRDELHALSVEVRGLTPVALAGRRDAVSRIRSALGGAGSSPSMPTDMDSGKGLKMRHENVHAPFSGEQVNNLNKFQRLGSFHPFTCGKRDQHPDDEGVLVAYEEGWKCPVDDCDYTQNWAIDAVADGRFT